MAYIIPNKAGYATSCTAGRGGSIIHVTTTADGTGAGTLRYALMQTGARNIVFDVCGEFLLDDGPVFLGSTRGNFHLWGQAAPGPIRIFGTIRLNCNNVCIEHVDWMGRTGYTNQYYPLDISGLNSGAQQIVISNVSFYHGWRGSFMTWTNTPSTANSYPGTHYIDVLDCICSENLLFETDSRGALVGANSDYISVQRTLFSNNDYRSGPIHHTGTIVSNINNYCWNPGNGTIEAYSERGAGACHLNIVGCVINDGANTVGVGDQIYLQGPGGGSTYYFSDNSAPGAPVIGSGWSAGGESLPADVDLLSSGDVSSYLLANAGARPWSPTNDTARMKTEALVNFTSRRGDTLSDWPTRQTITEVTSAFSDPANHTQIQPSGYSILEEYIHATYTGEAPAEIQPVTAVISTVAPTVDLPALVNIFNLDHETGDFSQYDSTNDPDGDELTVSVAAALGGTGYGMQVVIDDTDNIYATNNFDQFTSDGFRLRVYIDPNGLTMASGDSFYFVSVQYDGSAVFLIPLRYDGTNYEIRAECQRDDTTWKTTSYYDISDAPHYIEVDVQRASSAVASDGTMRLWIDGSLRETATAIDLYDLDQPNRQRLGVIGVDAGTSGTLYLDEYVLRDDHTEIGPVDMTVSVAPSELSAYSTGAEPTVILGSTSSTPSETSAYATGHDPVVLLSGGSGLYSLPSYTSPSIPSHTQSNAMSVVCYKPTIGSYLPAGTLVDDNIGYRLNSLSFTIKALGGYWSASFTVNDRLSKLEDWLDRLGYHIEIYNPSLVKVWEGFIVNAYANVGGTSVERGPFTEIGNEVATVYSSVDTATIPPTIGMRAKTAYATDATSQASYGTVEKHISIGGASSTTAEQIRDVWLEENKEPKTSKTFNSNSGATDTGITIECLGYVWWLNSYVYNQTASTGTLAISTIIQNVLAADPNGLFSTDYSNITTNTYAVQRYVNDDNLAWNYIKSLVSKGDTSNNRYLFGIYNDRKAYYAAIPTSIEYLQRLADPKQRIEQTNGIEVKPWDVRPGKWSQYTDFLIGKIQGSSLRDDERNVFIEQTTFSIPWSLSYSGSRVSTLDQKLAQLGLGGTG